MSEREPAGVLDTSVFVHAVTTDHHSEECRRFLLALEEGRVAAYVDPVVLHEVTYALKHYLKQLTRVDLANYRLSVLDWPGVTGDIPLMSETVVRWRDNAALSFVDAYIVATAAREGRPVYTKNTREFAAQGVVVPTPLPDGSLSDAT